jgi:NAD(P)-dependent dehydrogenase (short-subunit alcohol dehydrogenase family)
MNTSTTIPVVLITGAITGIGRATALAFARGRAKLVVSGRRAAEGAKLAEGIRALGSEAEFIQTDVRREDDVRRLVDGAVARSGRLDIAVNNAGTEGTPGPITEQSPESYAATFDTNVLGVLLSTGAAIIVQCSRTKTCIVTRAANLDQPDALLFGRVNLRNDGGSVPVAGADRSEA